MNRATRTLSFVRRSGGLAANLTHGAVLCLGLIGMTPAQAEISGLTGVSFADTRKANTRAAEVRAVVAAAPVELVVADGATRLPKLAVPESTAKKTQPRLKAEPRKQARSASAHEAKSRQRARTAQPTALAAADLRASALSAGVGSDDQELSPEMAKVRDWVAERYRVSEKSLEPALAAAEESASRLGFDPLLIVAIMAVESSFNPRAVSNMGAQGLMQVIPRYHQDKIGKQKSKYALFDPELNVRVGAEVLHEGLQRYGSMQRALQYYNGSLRDPKARYTRKVLSVKKHLLDVVGRGPMASRITLTSAG